MKKIMVLTLVSLTLASPVWALNLGKLKVPGTSTSTPSTSSGGQTIVNNATPQQQIVNDIKALIKTQYSIEGDWVMTGDIKALESLIASKYGAGKPATNKGFEWTLKPNGDTSGLCAYFKIGTPEDTRTQYRYIVNETCP